MKQLSLNKLINIIIFFFILSLYIFVFIEGLSLISNIISLLLIFLIWTNFLLSKRKLVFNNALLIYLMFFLLVIISIIFSINQDAVIIQIRSLFFIFLVMISLVNYIDTIDKLERFMVSFVYSGSIASIYILLSSDFSTLIRFGDQLGNVNSVGIIIGIAATFCIYFILEEKKYWYILLLFIMVPTILLTGSRKALLFIILNMIIILYFRNRKGFSNKIKFVVIGLFILLVISYLIFNVPIFYEIIGNRVENLISFIIEDSNEEASINVRNQLTSFGLEMFKDQPLTGYGIDNYKYLLSSYGGGNFYSHNNFIELLVGTGILGVLVFYLLHFVVLKDLFKTAKNNKYKTICYTFIAIIISYIVMSIGLVYYNSKHFSILLAVGSIISRVIVVESRRKTNGL
ncbi:hypothetical protein GI584_20415 [Gracilibacillus salitolerans]|uniref:O-antigen ligase-related domain-containing protein n=1 Tax=Gracilibacillus salitolerans TaxID=2663022 RepID=A0A5Q2TMS5_9BACI|nr:O-antigen ligase family protein [Gracilibacillus salitolerans]QGH36259.1 hypothetical protein GI584_20415 [Gracilibacillus salitolerans]